MRLENCLRRINIAIDGFSSCGKSTMAKDLAQSLGYLYIDSGAMYRAVTLYFLRNGVMYDDTVAVAQALKNIQIAFRKEETGHQTYLNEENVESEIRGMAVTNVVSPVAAISEVRRALVKQQRQIGERKGVVMDGRDIGTIVFPDAELKIFLTADLKTRVQRRFEELIEKGFDIGFEQVKKSILDRDRIDTSREDSPLLKADDAVEIDNSALTRSEQLEIVRQLALSRARVLVDT